MTQTHEASPGSASRIIQPPELFQAQSAEPDRKTSIVVVREAMTLSGYIPEWEELAAAALEPNVFYEHWMLLPALEAFGAGRDICFVLILIRDPGNPEAPSKLGGLFPLEFVPRTKPLQRPVLSTWQHLHACMGTPLIRADAVHECIAELLMWLRSGDATATVMELKWISGEGPFLRALAELFHDLGMTNWVTGTSTRELLRIERDAKRGGSAISGEVRRRLNRKEKRLSERGRVEHIVLKPGDDAGRWIEEFLRIETGSREGQRGSALACSESYRRYFKDMAISAFARGRLLMLGINFDGRPIARGCTLIAGEGSFALRTAIDEEFARFSPDAMLELDNFRLLGELTGVHWMDACPAGQNALINRHSNEKRTLQSLALGGGASVKLVLSGLPVMRWANDRLRGSNPIEPSAY
jgi:hypothetical protein